LLHTLVYNLHVTCYIHTATYYIRKYYYIHTTTFATYYILVIKTGNFLLHTLYAMYYILHVLLRFTYNYTCFILYMLFLGTVCLTLAAFLLICVVFPLLVSSNGWDSIDNRSMTWFTSDVLSRLSSLRAFAPNRIYSVSYMSSPYFNHEFCSYAVCSTFFKAKAFLCNGFL
jgi:hypothetical protein